MKDDSVETTPEEGTQPEDISRRAFLAKGAKSAAVLGAATVACYVAPAVTPLTVSQAYACSPRNDWGDDKDKYKHKDKGW